MARLVEVQHPEPVPSPLKVSVGDVILFHATGGRLAAGCEVGPVEVLGPFLPSVFGPDGEVVAPMGSPGTLLAMARAPGSAAVEVFTGGPSRSPRKTTVTIVVSA